MDALQDLHPTSPAYATLPIEAAFNWAEATVGLGVGEWYLVAFRSVRRADADEARLEYFDEIAHQEAVRAPGFVHYFKGPLAADRSCLSFCLWSSRPEARHAAGQPEHVRAVSLVAEMYERYELEFQCVRRDADGQVSFAPYDTVHPVHVAVPAEDDPAPAAPASPVWRLAPAT